MGILSLNLEFTQTYSIRKKVELGGRETLCMAPVECGEPPHMEKRG